jgi:hypothetical protein
MIGHLIAVQSWFSGQSERSELKQLGDFLTFQVERSRPLHVQYLYPRVSPPPNFSLSTKYVIQDIEAPPLETNPGYCLGAVSSHVINIRYFKWLPALWSPEFSRKQT